jgi:hypothetical protein
VKRSFKLAARTYSSINPRNRELKKHLVRIYGGLPAAHKGWPNLQQTDRPCASSARRLSTVHTTPDRRSVRQVGVELDSSILDSSGSELQLKASVGTSCRTFARFLHYRLMMSIVMQAHHFHLSLLSLSFDSSKLFHFHLPLFVSPPHKTLLSKNTHPVALLPGFAEPSYHDRPPTTQVDRH